MRLLGAILAGGQARRFGSDKAHALLNGQRLIDLVAAALAAQCEQVVVCGRAEPGFDCIPDHPQAALGPLGGLHAALRRAGEGGFDAVLSAGVDVPNLPADLARTLASGNADHGLATARSQPAIARGQPVIGLWPASLAPTLAAYLEEGGRALYGFADRVSAREIMVDPPLMNVNTPSDLLPQDLNPHNPPAR